MAFSRLFRTDSIIISCKLAKRDVRVSSNFCKTLVSYTYLVKKFINVDDVCPMLKYFSSSSRGTMSGELESSIKFILELYWRMISLIEVYNTPYVVSIKLKI